MATEIDTLSVRVSADTTPFQNALRDLGSQTDRFASAIGRAFKDAVVKGKDFETVLRTLALRLADIALDAALKPISSGLGSLLSRLIGGLGALTPFAAGGVPAGGRVQPLAGDGALAAPGYFPPIGGAGPILWDGHHAVTPLAPGADGRAAIAPTGGGAPVAVTINVTTQDAQSFRKAEAEITAMLARAVRRGRRGL